MRDAKEIGLQSKERGGIRHVPPDIENVNKEVHAKEFLETVHEKK